MQVDLFGQTPKIGGHAVTALGNVYAVIDQPGRVIETHPTIKAAKLAQIRLDNTALATYLIQLRKAANDAS
jgi:hypothetical protein